MELIEHNQNGFWDLLIEQQNPSASGLFLQTWQWGEFQKSLGQKIFRLAEFKDQKPLLEALIIKHNLPLGKSYFYCPRGPLIDREAEQNLFKEAFLNFIKKLRELAKVHRAIFFKLEPPVNWPQNLLRETGFLGSNKTIQPTQTLILDLRKSEEEIRAQFKPKARYNIKIALKHNVIIKGSYDFEKFWTLLLQTGKRDNFKAHPKSHYQKLLEFFKEGVNASRDAPFVKFYAAYKNNQMIGALMALFHYPWVHYLHGASDYKYRALMAPFLLHWNLIREAKEKNFLFYDLWGIDEGRRPGLTRFKEGFGGEKITTPGSFDLVFDKNWYRLYKMTKTLKRLVL